VTFTPPKVDDAVNVSDEFVAVGDFNGDGKLDLVTSGGSLLLGNGDGTFRSALNFAPVASCLAVADFNGDGHLDLAVANSYSNTVSSLLGSGNGTFQAAPRYS